MSRKNDKAGANAAMDGTESRCSNGAEVSLRILVPASRAGSIIGKVKCQTACDMYPQFTFGQGGEYVQSLRQESGAKIKIANTMPGCEERAVHISSPDRYDNLQKFHEMLISDEPVVPAQRALLKMLERIFADEVDNEGVTAKVSVRILVDNSQVGPLLGKAGATINSMREKSGANIKVIQGASDLPVFRGLTDELVQV